jgi:hypothetical protein
MKKVLAYLKRIVAGAVMIWLSYLYHFIFALLVTWGLWQGFGVWVNPFTLALLTYAATGLSKLVSEGVGSAWRRGSLSAKAQAEQAQAMQAYHMAQAHPELADFLGIHLPSTKPQEAPESDTPHNLGQFL